ncbi:MAG: histone deacetylase family protein [Pseudobdellovibrionaceae bacterium]
MKVSDMGFTYRIYSNPRFFQHEMGLSHPESPKRLESLKALFESTPYYAQACLDVTRMAEREDILRAHKASYLDILEESVPDEDYTMLDGDTSMNPASLDAAKLAAGAALQGVDDLLAGRANHVFIASRPPGHHAEPHKAMGFCFLNTVFIAASYARANGAQRVALLDFDVHHGNGTDAMMRDKDSDGLFFISTHEWPLYPGTGGPDTSVAGKILNIPLPNRSGSTEMRDIYKYAVFPALKDFNPDLVVVSAGFDAHAADPLASLRWTNDDYAYLGKQLHAYKTLACLEGGYDTDALAEAADAFLRPLFGIST